VRELDPVAYEPLDRGALDPVGAVLSERVVEVGSDRSGGGRVAQRVTGAALGDEQDLAVDHVRRRVLDRAPSHDEQYQRCRYDRHEVSTTSQQHARGTL